jgi:hypothetical protein
MASIDGRGLSRSRFRASSRTGFRRGDGEGGEEPTGCNAVIAAAGEVVVLEDKIGMLAVDPGRLELLDELLEGCRVAMLKDGR